MERIELGDNEYHFHALESLSFSGNPHAPFFSLGKHWEVQVVPSGYVYSRFVVRHRDFPDKLCSVFADVLNTTGTYLNGSPFWEVYPVKRDKKTGQFLADRCMLKDTKRLKRLINLSIRIQTENFGRNKKGRLRKKHGETDSHIGQ